MIRFTVCLFAVIVGLTENINGSPLGKLGTDRFARRHPSLNIIGGKNASIKDFPYVASITYNDFFLGSGAILNKRWIVTTAFNVQGFTIDSLVLRVGSESTTEGGQVLQVSKAVVPDEYSGWDWDVAVLQTSKPIRFGKKTKSIKLANKPLKVGAKGKIAGWGAVDETYVPYPTLQQTTVTVSDRTACGKVYGTILTDRLFCTFDKTTGPFFDDFGDPLVVKGQLQGLYAGGYDETPGTDPVLFTDIPKVRKWIKKNIKS